MSGVYSLFNRAAEDINQCMIATGNHLDTDSLRGAPRALHRVLNQKYP